MFTGLIEEQGKIISLKKEGSNLHIEIQAQEILSDMKLGDSIAIDGVCQTVTKFDSKSFWVTAIEETLSLTNFGEYQIGTKTNLERCLRMSDRLGGHIVQGHVDGVGEIKELNKLDGSYELLVKVPEAILKYIIYKGSIAINGISLTVAGKESNVVRLCIIPKTWEVTNLSQAQAGTKVNIEVDLVAKYIENFLVDSEKYSTDRKTLVQ